MRFFVGAVLVVVLSFCGVHVNAQFVVQRGVTFGNVIRFEQSLHANKLTDVHQGPLLKPNAPGLPEITVYKRALVFQRIDGTDTLEALYTGESNADVPNDKSPVAEGKFTWRTPAKEHLLVVRDSLLRSLDGTPREFSVGKRKLKKKLVRYNYAWSDPSGLPTVTIEYGEKAKKPLYLRMTILYSAAK